MTATRDKTEPYNLQSTSSHQQAVEEHHFLTNWLCSLTHGYHGERRKRVLQSLSLSYALIAMETPKVVKGPIPIAFETDDTAPYRDFTINRDICKKTLFAGSNRVGEQTPVKVLGTSSTQ